VTRGRHQSGQATIEFAGMLSLLLIAALFAWQLALVGWTFVQVANTARAVARLYSREESVPHAQQEGMSSLKDDGLGDKASVSFDGSRWSVSAYIPILLPGLGSGLRVTRTATMPQTG
jgi:membrane protein implicated in regulation of membrane protease activity